MDKLCFVIMGFGKKTDPSTGKTLDLDKTYKNIIQPAVQASGYQCIRADEIQDSGLIDRSMYALLMQADLVIADISTYNPNAIYELGIRHAVRPFSTIVLKEREGKIPFDLDHNRIFQYSHLGEDIGADEAKRCQEQLVQLIKAVAQTQEVDSPLYQYILNIAPPALPAEEYQRVIADLAEREKHIFAVVENARRLMKESNFAKAAESWAKASAIVPSEPYFIQQQALCTYKSKEPSEKTALIDALKIINQLEPDGSTNDPETLGITGAIYKRLWVIEADIEYLNRAIAYYGKCYKIRGDYYTGENYALCLNLKGAEESDDEERIYQRMEAKKTRQSIIKSLEKDLEEYDFAQRADRKWVYATLSHCHLAVGNNEAALAYERQFLESEGLQDWEQSTFYESKSQLMHLL